MKTIFCAIFILLNSVPAFSTPVQQMRDVKVNSCADGVCFEVTGSNAARSLLRDEYVVEDARLTIHRGHGKPEVIQAKSARTDAAWNNWMFETEKGAVVFDAESGTVEKP